MRKPHYTKALSLSRLAYDLEALVSPLLAALLLTVVSYDNLFFGTMLGFILSATFVLGTALPAHTSASPNGNLWQRTTHGIRIFARTSSLRFLMMMNLTVGAAAALVLVNTIVYTRDVFARSEADVAIALACYGAGSLLIAVNVPRLIERFGDRRLMLTGGVVVATLGLAGTVAMTVAAPAWPGAWWLLLGLWAVLGAGNSMISTPSARLLARVSTDATRGYVYTAQFALSHACFLITYPLAGWLGAASLPAAATVLAVIAGLGTLAAARSWSVVPAEASAHA